ncbi:MAG TPA: hypothetical protein VL221_13265 [Bacteroidota bacterium]|nr:hypothetical protein [Bacteroidota bacterium]
MRLFLLLLTLAALAVSATEAQTDSTRASSPEMTSGTLDSPDLPRFPASWATSDFLDPSLALPDTTPPAMPVRSTAHLLPENMSFMERGLWGESGFFRSIGIAGELTPEARKSELSARRVMLTMHQIGGFVTLGLLGATVYYGQRYLNYSDRTDRSKHQEFVTFAIVSYGLTGLLAVISPPPLIRRNETSTTTIHKTLAWIHFAGMVLTPIVGGMIRKRSGKFSYDDLATAHFHQVSAYITTGVFAASLVVITF